MKTILFCSTILLFALGCKKTNNSGTGNVTDTFATDIFPNKVGDTWSYLVNDTAVNTFNHNRVVAKYNMTITVIDSLQLPESIHGVQLPKGTEANVWVYNYPGGTDTNYVFQKGDTIRFVDINPTIKSTTYAGQYIIPLSLHNLWQYSWQDPISLLGDDNKVTVDLQADIIIGRNHFDNSFHIFGYGGLPDAGFTIDEWIENNVGILKRYSVSGGISGTNYFTASSLISFHLK